MLEAGFQAFFREGEHLLRKFCCRSRASGIRSACGVKQQAERFFSLIDRPFGELAQLGGNLKLRISHYHPACDLKDDMVG
jgi:hypothetical protein